MTTDQHPDPATAAATEEGWSVLIGDARAAKDGQYDLAMALTYDSDGQRGRWRLTARIRIDGEYPQRVQWDQDFPDPDARGALTTLWSFMDLASKAIGPDQWDHYYRPTYVDLDRCRAIVAANPPNAGSI